MVANTPNSSNNTPKKSFISGRLYNKLTIVYLVSHPPFIFPALLPFSAGNMDPTFAILPIPKPITLSIIPYWKAILATIVE